MPDSLSQNWTDFIFSHKLGSFKCLEYQVGSFALSFSEINSESIEISAMHFCFDDLQGNGMLPKQIMKLMFIFSISVLNWHHV